MTGASASHKFNSAKEGLDMEENKNLEDLTDSTWG